jgi:hypothetical protein
MNDAETGSCPPRVPRNKGKNTGPKPPLPWHLWAKLHLEKRTRDLAMFNLELPFDAQLRTSAHSTDPLNLCAKKRSYGLSGRQPVCAASVAE